MLIVVCALVGILVPDLPDFSDPLLVSADHRFPPFRINVIAKQRDLDPVDVWSVRSTRRTKWLQPRSCLKIKVYVFKEKSRFMKQIFPTAHTKSTFIIFCNIISVPFGFP